MLIQIPTVRFFVFTIGKTYSFWAMGMTWPQITSSKLKKISAYSKQNLFDCLYWCSTCPKILVIVHSMRTVLSFKCLHKYSVMTHSYTCAKYNSYNIIPLITKIKSSFSLINIWNKPSSFILLFVKFTKWYVMCKFLIFETVSRSQNK